MNALDLDSLPVLAKKTGHGILLFLSEVEILATSRHSSLNCHFGNLGQRILLDAVGRESLVDAGTERFVVNQELRVRSFVTFSQSLVLILTEIEVQHGEHLLKLSFMNLASAELIKIEEELLNSNSLHHNCCSQAFLDVTGIVSLLNSLKHESVADNISSSCISSIVA